MFQLRQVPFPMFLSLDGSEGEMNFPSVQGFSSWHQQVFFKCHRRHNWKKPVLIDGWTGKELMVSISSFLASNWQRFRHMTKFMLFILSVICSQFPLSDALVFGGSRILMWATCCDGKASLALQSHTNNSRGPYVHFKYSDIALSR